jgi:deoxycytidylate deaminase
MTARAGAEDSEVVIGFVGPVGVSNHQFVSAATTRLSGFGYHPKVIRLSECLDELAREGLIKTKLASEPEFERIRTHMNAGDELRGLRMPQAGGLLAAAAVAKIAAQRERYADGDTKPLPKHAWLISSLKSPDEVALFREIYGAGFFLVGLFATEKERRQSLERGMSPADATKLIDRDAESEEKHGQQTRKTFELADAWVRDENQLCRFLDLVFGDAFQTPTDDEDAMALAYTSSLRSSDLSRQVGAAIVARTGEVIATGRNEVPAPGGGQYTAPTDARPTARDCDVGVDSNAKERIRIENEIADVLEKRVRAELEAIGEGLKKPTKVKFRRMLDRIRVMVEEGLATTGLRDITEYGRPVHAEMSALTAVGRTGGNTRGAGLFCTTFPCHTCAKHIVAAGIARVVFVEPYPKSKARDLHADSIDLVGEAVEETRKSELTASLASKRTRFEPFLGVGPRRYFDLFSMKLGSGRSMQRKDERGDVLRFEPNTATPRIPLATTTYLEDEIQAAGVLEDARQLRPRKPRRASKKTPRRTKAKGKIR